MLAQPVGVGDLELELRHDAEHADGDLRRVQQVESASPISRTSPVAVTRRTPRTTPDRQV